MLCPVDLYSSLLPATIMTLIETQTDSYTSLLPDSEPPFFWHYCLITYLPTIFIPVFVPSQSGIPVSIPATCSLVQSVPEVFMIVAEVFMVATRLGGKGGGFGSRTRTDLKGRVWGAGICCTEIESARQPISLFNNPFF